MQIKKIDEEQTYVSKTTEHTFDVDGKIITVYDHYLDSTDGDNEYDREIVEGTDYKKLTEDEKEAFDDELDLLLDMKVGDITNA